MIARPTVFTALNAHSFNCGLPPELPEGNYRRSYFENAFGDQWVFFLDLDTGEAQVRSGDIGWGQELRVAAFEDIYGSAPAEAQELLRKMYGDWPVVSADGPYVINRAEQLWLAGCMIGIGD
jgi:hypothetical protein